MPETTDRLARTLSWLTAAALAIQAVGGLLIPGLYRDNAWIVSIYRGTDLGALLVDVPLLVVALLWTQRGSMRARLVWLGTLSYVWYNNLYFLFGTAFNPFFLVYVAIFVLSAAALTAALLGTDARALAASLRPGAPRRSVAVIEYASAAVLGVMWVGQCLAYVATGQLPSIVTDAGGSTHCVAALDLTVIVPPLVLGARWLWRSRPWGLVVSGGMLVQCTLITVDLVSAAPFQAASGIPDAWTMVPLWALMGAAFLAGAVLLLRALPSGVRRSPA